MHCTHDHDDKSDACPFCADDPEEAARRTATATGFAGSVLGAVGGPVGAGLGGLVGGTAGYVAGYTAAEARGEADSSNSDPVTIETKQEDDGDEHDQTGSTANGDDTEDGV